MCRVTQKPLLKPLKHFRPTAALARLSSSSLEYGFGLKRKLLATIDEELAIFDPAAVRFCRMRFGFRSQQKALEGVSRPAPTRASKETCDLRAPRGLPSVRLSTLSIDRTASV